MQHKTQSEKNWHVCNVNMNVVQICQRWYCRFFQLNFNFNLQLHYSRIKYMKFINRINYNVHMKNSLEQRIFSVIKWAYTAVETSRINRRWHHMGSRMTSYYSIFVAVTNTRNMVTSVRFILVSVTSTVFVGH